ncbi:MAG: hypothetical protein IIX27_03280 [Ruminococcus sp.]|nr:hypothetical protein [Ruminococcus sp.]
MKKTVKKLLALIIAVLLCLSFTACKNRTENVSNEEAPACSEQTIRELMEKNLDCYFLFYVSPIPHTTQQNSDGYFGTQEGYFESYEELKNFVFATYTDEKATAILEYPEKDAPVYKDSQGLIFVDPTLVPKTEYPVSWEEYDIDMNTTDTTCTFTLTTTDFDGNEYTAEGKAVLEDNEWRLADLVY